jgi:cell shape-determining protein MreD
LQIGVFHVFAKEAVLPNLLLCVVVVYSLFFDMRWSLPIALIGGIFVDESLGLLTGVSSLFFVLVALLLPYLTRNFNNQGLPFCLISVAVVTALWAAVSYAAVRLFVSFIDYENLIKTTVIWVVENGIATLLLFAVFSRGLDKTQRRITRYAK